MNIKSFEDKPEKKFHKVQGPISKCQIIKVKKINFKKDTSKKKTRDRSG